MEGNLILEHPEYEMQERILLRRIDFNKGKIRIVEKDYELADKIFPTVDIENLLTLTEKE